MARAPVYIVRIPNADRELYTAIRLEAVRRHVTTAEIFNEIVREWLERRAASSPALESRREPPTAVP